MDNHYHLLVEIPEQNLSKGTQYLNGIYTRNDSISSTAALDTFFKVATKQYWCKKNRI